MNITVLKRPNNFISHDRLDFKRLGPSMFSDTRQTRHVYDITSIRLTFARHSAKLLHSFVLVYVYRQCIVYNSRRTTTIHSVTQLEVLLKMILNYLQVKCGLWRQCIARIRYLPCIRSSKELCVGLVGSHCEHLHNYVIYKTTALLVNTFV